MGNNSFYNRHNFPCFACTPYCSALADDCGNLSQIDTKSFCPLDFGELGIEVDPHKVGCSEYDPEIMLKLLVYGYSYGVRSSRKLERVANYNLSFIWLTGGLKTGHKTIAEFRRRNKTALQKVLKQCARLCIIEQRDAELFVIDEIGKMECMSERFVAAVQWLLASDKSVLATVSQKVAGLISEDGNALPRLL